MDEMEIRALREHTNALDEHSRALTRMANLLEEVMSTPNGGVANLVTMMSSMQEVAWQLHGDAGRFAEAAETISTAARMAEDAANGMQEASRRQDGAAAEMLRAANRSLGY